MLKHWWKILGVLLVGYAVFRGLTVPVGPGIASVTPDNIDISTETEMHVRLYNSFDKEGSASVWLKSRDYYLHSEGHITNNEVVVSFGGQGKAIPDSVKGRAFTIFVQSANNGVFGLPQEVIVKQSDEAGNVILTDSKPKRVAANRMTFPFRNSLYESIRNLNFHVPMWFTMITLLFVSFVFGIMYLLKENERYDQRALAFSAAGLLYGLLGVSTGAFWARFTWGDWWPREDVKLIGAGIGVLIYVAYFILRNAITDDDTRGRVSSVYGTFAFPLFIVLIIVIPKMQDASLHPGSGDTVGFNTYDLDNNLRMVFYPAVLGWILIGTWIANLYYRTVKIEKNAYDA